MLAVVGEALLYIGTIEYDLGCGIPRFQSYFGMPISACYKKPRIPSLGDQKEPCEELRDRVRQKLCENVRVYDRTIEHIDWGNEDSIRSMFDFVQLADSVERVFLEIALLVRLIPGLQKTRNDLMHSTKLESREGLIVTTAHEPARIIQYGQLSIFLRKSRQAAYISSALLVGAVAMTIEGDKLYSSFDNESNNSRFLRKFYRNGIVNLSNRWRKDLEAYYANRSVNQSRGHIPSL